MRPITKLTMFAFAASAIAAPAVAASDIYLKLGDIKGESAGRSAAGAQIEVSSFQFGITRKGWDGTIKGRTAVVDSAPPSAQVAAGDVNADGSADATLNLNSSKSNANREIAVSDPGASGPKTTSKRQHGWNTVSKPLDRGSVTVMGNFPGCTVGAAYADAVLQTSAMRYELKEVLVSSCTVSGSTGGDDAPTESVTLNYASYRESPTRASQK